MSYSFYHFLHLTSIVVLFMCLASMATSKWIAPDKPWPKWFSIAHGLSLLIVLVGGFGMLARLGMTAGLPTWIYVKLIVWGLLGAMLALIKRAPQKAQALWITSALLGFIAIYVVSFKG